VIAANVLHATRNIRQTLRNAKAALRSNGVLLLNELSANSLFTHLTFGLLEGWWLYEDPELRIPGCPGLAPVTWQEVLEREGFRSVFFPAREGHELGQQIIVAESDGVVRQPNPAQKETGLLGENPISQRPSIKTKANQLPLSIRAPQQSSAQEKTLTEQKSTTRYRGIDVTDQMVEDHVRTIIRESIADALKMEEGHIRDDYSFSDYGVDSIVAVNLINDISKRCQVPLQTTVLFDYNTVALLTRHITETQRATLITALQEHRPGVEETQRASQRTAIPVPQERQHQKAQRLKRSRQRPRFYGQDAISFQEPLIMDDSPIYHRVVIERPGEIPDLQVIASRVPELQDHEIRVAVRAFSLNFGDLLCVSGLYPTMPPYPFTPGFEASGIVANIGRKVTSVRQGDAVIVLMGEALGGQASMITCSAEQVFQKPSSVSFEEACALPVVAITMIAAFHKAGLKRGERILIQTAAGGTGLIAVQLAHYYGAEIYATAGSQQKLEYLKHLDVPYRINYQETDFEREIQRLTDGRGVDVVINTLSGEAIQKGLNCLSPGGRYIEIAMTAMKSAKTIDLSVLNSNQAFYSLDVRKLGFEDPDMMKDYQREMLQLVEQDIIHPTICQVFPLNQIQAAYRYLENRQNIGKIVVSIPEAYQFQATPSVERTLETTRPFTDSPSLHRAPIAIIGMSGRFARSKSVNELWEHLSQGDDLIGDVSRWDLAEYYADASQDKKTSCWHGGFLTDIDQFDPLFFNISGLEATYMDPQQRCFLEEVWKTLEDAGYAGTGVEGRLCGVYVGWGGGDYQQLMQDIPPAQAFWGNAGSGIPARIAYHLNLQGPAVAIDTACSSSLVAMHLACQGLWAQETELALAGGVFIQSTPAFYLSANQAGMLSPTGRCHTFDERADGFVPGEGVGVVMLKRLSEAMADGDHIYGVIRGSGINQDGATNGITAPSATSQERLERSVYDTFQIHPEQIQMVEAHGTGTILGDPIEYDALTRAFRHYTEKQGYCAIGSIKTNLGHAATAAGIAGVIKILLSLQHKQIPASLHYQAGNPNIQFERSPFYVNTRLKDWNVEPNATRCAVLSSFGFTGTNAHMAIEEAPRVERRHADKSGYVMVLSARTSEQLRRQVEQLVAFCEHESHIDCGNMSYTLFVGRKHFQHRLACVIRSQKELVALLEKWLEKGKVLQIYVSSLSEHEHREQPPLKRYGNQCIQNCRNTENASEYLELLATIAELYVQGYILDFDQLFANDHYSRISLPTYPFARERYWIPEASNDSLMLASKNGQGRVENQLIEFMYLPLWEEQPPLISVEQHRPHTVLVVYSESSSEFEKTILNYYRQTTQTIIQIQLSQQTTPILEHDPSPNPSREGNKWRCNMDDPQGFETCLQGYDSIDCVYFISDCHETTEPFDVDALSHSQQHNEIQLLRLIKCLQQHDTSNNRIDCCIITQDNYRIGDTHINPYGGGITGLAYSIAQGDQRFSVRNIDISSEELMTSEKQDALLRRILNEESSDKGEVVKFKSGSRYKQVFFNLDLDRFKTASGLKKAGVYVILGGSGTIGGIMTQYLMQAYNAQVIWIGRTPATSHVIREKIESFRGLGNPPRYIQADVTCLEQMQHAVTQIKSQYPTINGAIFSGLIFHAENSVKTTSEIEFIDILNVKTKGSLNFYAAFQDELLDFMCYFSSGQAFSFSGAANFSAYASGITFSDGFVQSIQEMSKFPVGTINWGFWKSTLKEDIFTEHVGALEDREGFDCFEWFSGALQEGVLHQIMCLQASDSVRELMNRKEDEIISICEKRSDSLIQSLWEGHKDEENTVNALIENHESEEFDEWLSKLLFVQMRQMGLLHQKRPPEEIAALWKKAGVIDKYDRWFEESLTVLARQKYLQYDGASCTVIDPTPLDRDAVWKEWGRQKSTWLDTNPIMNAMVVLVEATLRALPDILMGNVPATDIMFPNSSMALVEGIYQHNPVADYFNAVLAETITAYLQARIKQDSSARIRILEIGAGTGGTSARVFQTLQPYQDYIQDYCYTDISRAFLLHAEKEYGPQHPYLTCHLFDVEAPLAGQGIDTGVYDLVIAANVLHATRNICRTLRNAKAALRSNGVLLLNELSANSLFTHLTFGLLEGWWLYEDPELRIPGCPGLAPATWQEVLEHEGFRSVFFPAREGHELGQQIIVAESDGVVRQPNPAQKETGLLGENPISQHPIIKAKANQLPLSIRATQQSSAYRGMDVTDQMVEEYVRETIREKLSESLKVDRDLIDGDESFGNYGLDSILGVQCVQSIKQTLMIELETTSLFEYSSVNQLAAYLVSQHKAELTAVPGQHGEPGSPQLDVTSETDEKPSVASRCHFLSRKVMSQPQAGMASVEMMEAISPRTIPDLRTQHILVTGVTGVLGANLLKELLERTESQISCLVRADNAAHAKARIKTFLSIYDPQHTLSTALEERVTPIVGDITDRLLGMEHPLYEELSQTIDLIIHAAGATNLYEPYKALKPINVDGTRHVIDFALTTRQKYIVYTSTYSIMGSHLYTTSAPFTEQDFDIGQSLEELPGYVRTKFEAERCVRLATEQGLQWMIVRPGNIFGESEHGYYPLEAATVTGFQYDILKTMAETGIAPFEPMFFDITPVDYVSQGIIALSTQRKSIYETYHLVNPDHKRLYDIFLLLQEYGFPIRLISPEEYREKLENDQLTKDGAVYRSISTELSKSHGITITPTAFSYADASYTQAILERAGIRCPNIDLGLLSTYLEYCVRAGYFSPPQNPKNTPDEQTRKEEGAS
ncbi:MAG: SDR family NAD(P)-dependent oxidoreductase, partial [bacterium]|nr:SDR family NAD(P)-dependent oxidoreductase [bacterium]